MLGSTSRGIPGPSSLTVKHHGAVLARRRHADVPAGIGEADGVGDEVEEDLPDAALVDVERADILRDGHLQLDLLLGEPVAQPVDRRARHRRDVGLADVERHDAGVDGGEVEDVVDEGAAARATTNRCRPCIRAAAVRPPAVSFDSSSEKPMMFCSGERSS